MTATIQDQVGETAIDYNALDNTTAGRALQAAFVGAFYAVPDYVARGRGVASLGVLAALVATIGVFNSFDEDPRNDLTAQLDHGHEVGSPAKTWGLLVGLTAGLAGALAGHVKFHGWLNTTLRKKGWARPHTRIGAAAAIATFAVTEALARR
ncbi:hypothetical protein [Corynebacterium aquatimens]|uniref:Uncharacterized protein n=1 Tax=Corynebacterium aquatimens TaxID=1190508 RepID=A0A931GUB4_9CORY|nr:hypothetical protein [Corynebacterium aquatimens]MBG6122595.1 hypothetical protein [Corynebacterium aquatimens]WJY64865.1 hypothetical protein CAQUA_00585 [Corynebacterium aquatimens]